MFLHLSVILLRGVGCVSQHALGRGCLPVPGECLPHTPGQTPPQVDTPWAYTPLGRHPLGIHSPEQTPSAPPPPQKMATAVDSTHPTGMHSCCFFFYYKL